MQMCREAVVSCTSGGPLRDKVQQFHE
ncbi:hypothetical protein GBAR_LOCUS22448 [Geodia barretti]|uniref:Uncharacterized protein n=1 Tax=Geodia barretti TaxID=519541 RepID=A0AA35X5B7_GEOBA|nr:hypothetical protein GBAR_LOCUS22448 [Geodia barretti]